MKHRTLTALTCAALAVSLTACSTTGEAEEGATQSATSSPPPSFPSSPTGTPSPSPTEASTTGDLAADVEQVDDQTFALVVRATYPDTANLTDDEIVTLATGTCERLEAGEPYMGLLLELAQSDATEAENAVSVSVMTAGMLNYCPDQYAEAYPG